MVAIGFTAAAAIIPVLLTFSSVRNIAETIYITNNVSNVVSAWNTNSKMRPSSESAAIFQQYLKTDGSGEQVGMTIHVPREKSSKEIVDDLSKMNKKELIALFLLCDAPEELALVEGSWDASLLDNNPILVSALYRT